MERNQPWAASARPQPKTGNLSGAEVEKTRQPPARPGDRCMNAVRELESVLPRLAGNSMLRYEAFTRLFALLGSMPDSDTVEIIQTGLGGVEWEKLAQDDRERFAEHLRHLADQVLPEPVQPDSTPEPVSAPAPALQQKTVSAGPDREIPAAPKPAVKPQPAVKSEPALPPTDTAYDRGRFGEQAHLVAALKEQPEDVSLDQLLSVLMRESGGRH